MARKRRSDRRCDRSHWQHHPLVRWLLDGQSRRGLVRDGTHDL